MKNKILITLCLVLPLFVGCDSGGSDGDGGGITKVEYSVDCQKGPSCNNVSDISQYTGSRYTSINCKWYCGSYNGQKGVYVSLTFDTSNGCWELDREYISTGICD